MKKLYTLFVLCIAVSLSACKKDFLDKRDPNAVPVANYFKTEEDVLGAVNGCYQALRSPYSFGENSGLFTDERSDDMVRLDVAGNNGEPFQFSNFSLQPSNSYVKNHWTTLYSVIARCNTVLSNIDNVTFGNADNKSKFAAEVKFIRALSYFELVRKWGAVPLSTKQITSAAEATQYTFRADEKTVYTQIVADLTDAVNSKLPNTQFEYQVGRVSRSAAAALLGKVYLTMATTIDPGNKQANLTEAKKNLTTAYDLRPFGNLSEIAYTDVFDQAKQPTCKELIFQIVNVQGDVNYSSSIAFNYQVKGETINSLKNTAISSYVVKRDLINEYETGDPRAAFSVKYANDLSVQDYFVTKYRDTNPAATANGYGGNDWVLIRYADVILMLAEVNNYLGDNGTATQYLNMVRQRAGLPSYAASIADAAYNSQYADLKLAILHERRSEFAFEHQRWFDLLRFFTTDQLVAFFHAKAQASYGASAIKNFSSKDRFFPIPFDEYKLNPEKMYQNPGY